MKLNRKSNVISVLFSVTVTVSVKELLLLIFGADVSGFVSDKVSAEVPGVPVRIIVAAMICPTFLLFPIESSI